MKIISKKDAKTQGLKRYFTGKPCKYGHVAERYVGSGKCIECDAEYYQANKERIAEQRAEYRQRPEVKERRAEYRQNNKERMAEYYQANKERIAEQKAEYYQANKERLAEQQAEYRANNKERKAEYQKERYNNDPDYKAACIVRRHLRRVLLATNTEKSGQTFESVGYSSDEFKAHIEKQFTDGMSWDNYGEWHIDHITPVAEFIRQGEIDPKVINALPNLMPLWASENISKKDSIERLI